MRLILKNKYVLTFATVANTITHMPKKKKRCEWLINPPTDTQERLALIKKHHKLLKSPGPKGRMLRALLSEVESLHEQNLEKARDLEPLHFFKPSFEQALMLNSWMLGIAFNCIYTANRIGKTTASIINILLWLIPNDPKWKIFQPYIDAKGRYVRVFPRPNIFSIKTIRHFREKEESKLPLQHKRPDPNLPIQDPINQRFLQRLQTKHPHVLDPAYPKHPWPKGGTIWFGGPDQEHHEKILLPLWKKYIPKRILERFVISAREITMKIPEGEPDRPEATGKFTVWELTGKSYESKDTKWSSGAVNIIMLTEGVIPSIWSEVKARFLDPGIGSHDFTPYEPANQGAATSLAQKIKKGSEEVPLPHHVFENFSVYDAPEHIITPDQKKGLIKAYKGKPEEKARLEGTFYTTSALVLANFNRSIHLLPFSIEEMFKMFPEGRIYRAVDPGLDHPTACCWAYVLPSNIWIYYRFLAQRGLTIPNRCRRIIEMSNNTVHKVKWGKQPHEYYLQEIHNKPNSEIPIATVIDYHVFKMDESTGLQYATNYHVNGLAVTESIHTGPEDRAITFDSKLELSPFVPHLLTRKPPGPQIYFLQYGEGVMETVQKWEEFYWDRKKSGPDKGEPTDKLPSHGDDELDAGSYIAASPFVWTNYRPPARLEGDAEPESELIEASYRLATKGTLQPLQNEIENFTPNQEVGRFGISREQRLTA